MPNGDSKDGGGYRDREKSILERPIDKKKKGSKGCCKWINQINTY